MHDQSRLVITLSYWKTVTSTGRAVVRGSFQLDRRLALVTACLAKARESGKRIDPAHEHLPDDAEFGSTERGKRSKLAHFRGSLAVSLVEEAEGGTARLADCLVTAGRPDGRIPRGKPDTSRNAASRSAPYRMGCLR